MIEVIIHWDHCMLNHLLELAFPNKYHMKVWIPSALVSVIHDSWDVLVRAPQAQQGRAWQLITWHPSQEQGGTGQPQTAGTSPGIRQDKANWALGPWVGLAQQSPWQLVAPVGWRGILRPEQSGESPDRCSCRGQGVLGEADSASWPAQLCSASPIRKKVWNQQNWSKQRSFTVKLEMQGAKRNALL